MHREDPAYGHRRVAWKLGINHKRALRVMNKFEIKPPRRRIKHFCTRSTSHHTYTNLIKDLTPSRPHEVWCSDVSYFKFQGRFWYLITIQDVATRQVIASRVGKYHNSQLVLSTLKEALRLAVPKYFHCDQGTEFMAKACTDYLESYGVTISVSDTASPWQNGYLESFFGRFKTEFGDFNRFDCIGELVANIYQQIHYYNFKRIHTKLKTSPVKFAVSKYSDYCLQKRGT